MKDLSGQTCKRAAQYEIWSELVSWVDVGTARPSFGAMVSMLKTDASAALKVRIIFSPQLRLVRGSSTVASFDSTCIDVPFDFAL